MSADSDDVYAEVAFARVVTRHGLQLALVDLAVTRAPTRPCAPSRTALEEMRTAATSDRIRIARDNRARRSKR